MLYGFLALTKATYLERSPGEKLQPYEGVEQLGQAQADVSIPVGCVVF